VDVASGSRARGLGRGGGRDAARLRKDLQTKIRIIGRPGRGRIELHYFGEAELERLTEVLLRSRM